MHAVLVMLGALAAPLSSAGPGVDLTLHGGGVIGDGYAGVLVGASVLARTSVVGGGVTLEASRAVSSRLGAAFIGGVSYRADDGLGVDLLGALGAHHYEGVGRSILSTDAGASGTTSFAGGRARISFQYGREARRLHLGGTASVDADLARANSVGFTTLALTLDAGVTFL